MAANAKNEKTTSESQNGGELDVSALENIDWEAVRATNPDLADLLEMSLEQNAELRETISKGATEKKAREPQTLAARVNRALTTPAKGLNAHGVTVVNTGKSPIGDIDNGPLLDGLRRVLIECGVPEEALDGVELKMGEHFLSYALLGYNLAETRAWQPPKGEKTAEPQAVTTAGDREDDETEDDDNS